MDLLAMARREAVHVRIGCGDRVDPPREQSVDAAQHGILLMDQGRDAIPLRGEKGRQGGVAAKADHGGRTEGLIKARDRKSTRLTPVTNAHLVCRLLLEKKK